jgi:hypothetical protein
MAAWSAGIAGTSALAGDVPGAAVNATVTFAVGVPVFLSHRRWVRSGEKSLRAELAALVIERQACKAWLNRDEHLIFMPFVRRWPLPDRSVMVVDEEQAHDAGEVVAAGGGRVAVTAVSFGVLTPLAKVMRRVDGAVADVTGEGEAEVVDGPKWGLREWRRHLRFLASGRSFADLSELAEVIAQFRAAEPIDRDGDPL